MIKTLIYIDVFLIFLSLGSALYFLIVDQGKVESKRTANSLGFRVALAVILIILVTIGLITGELGNSVPWDGS
ncbi:DUF2909 domain-containing protein [Gammaproteobacteria bacterium]|jgi:hypothetical protein|nr:DUF2909 domain-containing protein [Gammaproteobacteria bacterium]MDA7800662.1 DUF2909 domain-containing protein [Gammaproteobacteria bacterium]MDA7819064.1 DUF2909 domain-containing protein [Gammaproteobacteria bacterium]MDA8674195.1 DUF2909 domain-containing protein [Gammaproteobacteria bacterium]MDA8864976.1 DUF2909 domain-containing protein [Gammaproteobacteria bacterium]